MSQPVQVDSKISFNTNAQSNTSHSQHSIDLDQTDSVSAFGSDHGRRVDQAINTSYGTEEGALHQQITNMANLLQDVVQELKCLKFGGSGNSHQTAPDNSLGLDSGFKPYHTEFPNDRHSTATVVEGDGDFNHLSTQMTRQASCAENMYQSADNTYGAESHYQEQNLGRASFAGGEFDMNRSNNTRHNHHVFFIIEICQFMASPRQSEVRQHALSEIVAIP